ncbi:HNH endonuclease signature motif containing protein [Methylophilus rhizosphaerae]|uniref:HNH endonuclease signature motif containing protein n=1 Tax=Methylophilus rhizosphaerae TaxID=492660 RepID=UPI000B8720FC
MNNKTCKKCGSNEFGSWTSSSTNRISFYCRSCQKNRSRIYQARRLANGGEHTRTQWLNKLKSYFACPNCNRLWENIPLRPNKRYKNPWTKDHIVPIVAGGNNNITNIQPLCYQCNFSKSSKFQSEQTGIANIR